MDGFKFFGDWRDLRGAIERSYPDWSRLTEGSRAQMWVFAEGVIREHPVTKVRCLECKDVIGVRAAYRCTECKAHLCESCIYPHFGQAVWRHK